MWTGRSAFQIPQFPQPSICNHPHCSPNFCQQTPSLPKPHEKEEQDKDRRRINMIRFVPSFGNQT